MKKPITVEAPKLYNPYERAEILCNLDSLARCAFFLAGDDQMGLRDMVEQEFDSTIEEYDPEGVYFKSHDEMIFLVDSYNLTIKEDSLLEPLIEILVDEEKTGLLKDVDRYPIYKVVLCNEPI